MKGAVAGLALTWDGARWPTRRLPARAQRFLGRSRPLSPRALARATAASEIRELRICWVPRLRGGAATLCEMFSTPEGKRLPFRLRRMVRFGEVLGAVYVR